jgi:hypothetical protein
MRRANRRILSGSEPYSNGTDRGKIRTAAIGWRTRLEESAVKRTLVLLVMMLASVACSKGGTTVTPASPSPSTSPTSGGIVTSPPGATGATGSTGTDIGITGTWTGSWQTDADAAVKGTFTIEFVQQGEDISGDITIQGSACVTQGSIIGKVQGDKIEFGAVQAEQTVTYAGAISGDSLSGTYDSPQCGPDTGTWEATRV